MLMTALPLLLIWLALPLAAVPLFRRSSLPTVTMALTLTAAVLAALAVGLAPVLPPDLGTTDPATMPSSFLTLGRSHYLIGLSMWLLGAGGLVLLAGGLAKGRTAGLMRNLGAAGLVLLHLAAALQMLRLFLPLPAPQNGSTDMQSLYFTISMADTVTALGFFTGSLLILGLAVQGLLSLLRRG
ncbi:hypothetical protein [Pseudotabrizicola sp. L79]|uniref:hypothetical protein n=1 Tax=Pseudotabrizicola sp. L79 TaxID=3118402 RepID=UPI002F91E4B3